MNYQELISKSQQELEAEALGFKVEAARNQLNQDILATKIKVSEAKQEVSATITAVKFDSKKIIESQLNLEGYEAGLKRLLALQAELFPEEVKGNVDAEVKGE